jgi:alpha-galactosidase/6-phospho-beta-glucosidase family protein
LHDADYILLEQGSIGFTRTLVRDTLAFPRLSDAELVLMDIDAERLEFAERSVKRIIELGNYPATVKTTLSRAEALQGADVVMVTILAGGVQVWRHDIEIPKQYGSISMSVTHAVPSASSVPCGLSPKCSQSPKTWKNTAPMP